MPNNVLFVTREIDMAYAFVATTILQFKSHHNTASMSNFYFHANYSRFEFCDYHIVTFSKPLLISKGIRASAYPTTYLTSWPLAMIFWPQRLIHSKSQKRIRNWNRKIRAIYFDVGGKVISTTGRNYGWQIFVYKTLIQLPWTHKSFCKVHLLSSYLCFLKNNG